MHEQNKQLHERLLQDWQFRRKIVNYYSRALLLLAPDDCDASQRWQELNEKLSIAQLALCHTSDQLSGYEQEFVRRKSVQQ